MSSKACDVTGVVGIACARHGCFAPNGLVDLFKGEQQKNVDGAFLNALNTTNIDEEQGILLIYDIACQYFVHFQDRIGHLLPQGLQIDAGIGSFHVHGHKNECFFRYGTSFIPFSGITAGEILESLWANMNTISPVVQTATLAHRSEILDDHASDSNHKKAVGLCKYISSSGSSQVLIIILALALSERFVQAKEMLAGAEEYLRHLSSGIPQSSQTQWEQDVQSAETYRSSNPAVMDILAADAYIVPPTSTTCQNWDSSPVEQAIEMALAIEEKQ